LKLHRIGGARAFALLVAVLWFAMTTAGRAQSAIPPLTFFANDDIGAARLSPSGRHLALSVPATSGRMVLAVVAVDSDKPPVVVASASWTDINSFEWVNDDRLVYNTIDLQSPAWHQGFGPGLYSVRRDGSEARQLIRSRWDVVSTGTNISSSVLAPNHAWLGYPSGALDWVIDRNGEPRAVYSVSGGVSQVFWRDVVANTWRSMFKVPTLQEPWLPLAVDGADQLYVLTESAADSTLVLKRFDFKSEKPEDLPLASTPGFDVRPTLMFDRLDEKRLVGIRVNTDAETTVWLDPERKKLQELADARFPGRVNRLHCRDCFGDGALLVESFSDRDPGTYSVYRPSTQTWTTIGKARRAVDPRQMALLDLHRIKARDGLELPVWVTTPSAKASGPQPAVVLVHGGPWLRGTEWKWNADAQFLASRGYVVIEPEFRGSTGFGQRHFRAGFKNWGTSMQDDIADAVRWAVEKGIVDGKRVCIAGASYGGYATFMGAIRHPDLYRCGVAWVAVTDPRLMFEETWANDLSREAQRYQLPAMLGDPIKDADMLKAATPVERAKEIKIQILMAFGLDDRRVPLEHGKRMRAALQAAGQQPEYVVYDGEGHGWLKVENRIDFWTRVEKFLAKNLN
jgi:acetyl esterase/lipase